MPKVSVIIPNYNHAVFLQQRIESVLQQTFRDFELIILDDLSGDNSREIIEPYRSHSNVSHIVYNDSNSGSPFKQWQKGIELATGEYIWIAESDDYCEPILLETLMKGIGANPRCTVSYCQSYYIDDKGSILRAPKVEQLERKMNGIDFINTRLVYHSVIYNASMVVFKKEAYYTISKDFTSFKFCGDWVFWSEIASRGDVFISGKFLNYFRFHASDVSGRMYTSGNSFVEQFRCLLLLKQKFSIQENVYRKALSYYTTRYFIQKKNFSETVITSAQHLLNEKENKRHKFYLRKKWAQNRISRLFLKISKKIDAL